MRNPTQQVIAVGVDTESQDMSDLDWAIATARLTGAQIRLVLGARATHQDTDSVRELHRELHPWITYVTENAPDVQVTTSVRQFSAYSKPQVAVPSDELAIESHDAELLVINHCHHRHMLGEMAGRVIDRSWCPVVVVPDNWSEPDTDQPLISIGIGDHRSYDEPLRFVFDQADRLGARVEVLHAWDVKFGYGPSIQLPVENARVLADAQRERVEQILHPWREKYANTAVELRIVRGDPVPVLTKLARTAHLLVLGHRAHAAWEQRLLGRITQEVLSDSPVPVALVPKS